MEPQFEHDCGSCVFLGISSDGKFDLYLCPQSGIPTIIARFSSNGPDYYSGMCFAKSHYALNEAFNLAKLQRLNCEQTI